MQIIVEDFQDFIHFKRFQRICKISEIVINFEKFQGLKIFFRKTNPRGVYILWNLVYNF